MGAYLHNTQVRTQSGGDFQVTLPSLDSKIHKTFYSDFSLNLHSNLKNKWPQEKHVRTIPNRLSGAHSAESLAERESAFWTLSCRRLDR